MDEDLETPEWKELIRTRGERRSRSAEAAREKALAEIRQTSI